MRLLTLAFVGALATAHVSADEYFPGGTALYYRTEEHGLNITRAVADVWADGFWVNFTAKASFDLLSVLHVLYYASWKDQLRGDYKIFQGDVCSLTLGVWRSDTHTNCDAKAGEEFNMSFQVSTPNNGDFLVPSEYYFGVTVRQAFHPVTSISGHLRPDPDPVRIQAARTMSHGDRIRIVIEQDELEL